MLGELHQHIELLKNGDTRFCVGHGDIFDSKYFPYKSSELCVYCYEQEHSRILHTFRKKLGVKDERQGRQKRNIDTRFKRETNLETIKKYIYTQKQSNSPLTFYYRQDTSPRKVSDYFIDDRYVQVRSDKGYYIKFLIDKIRKI